MACLFSTLDTGGGKVSNWNQDSLAKRHRVPRATVVRLVRDAKQPEMVAAA